MKYTPHKSTLPYHRFKSEKGENKSKNTYSFTLIENAT